YETGIYVLAGRVQTRWGKQLEHEVVSEPGDFLFVPPGVPHEAINLSDTEPARAIVARNDAAEQDKVEPYPNAA
ncbi:MAG TPA: cupin domain-containing protein, partial [Gemmatimonadaceae bacterium]